MKEESGSIIENEGLGKLKVFCLGFHIFSHTFLSCPSTSFKCIISPKALLQSNENESSVFYVVFCKYLITNQFLSDNL